MHRIISLLVTFFLISSLFILPQFSFKASKNLDFETEVVTLNFVKESIKDKLNHKDNFVYPQNIFSIIPELSDHIQQNYAPGEIIIKTKQKKGFFINSESLEKEGKFGVNSLDALGKEHGLQSIDKVFKNTHISKIDSIYKLTFSEDADIQSIIKTYQKDPNIEYVEPNYIYKLFLVPNDPYFDIQWALNQSNDCDIDAPDAWNISTGSSDIVIAVIDTGVDWEHEDLADNIWVNTAETVNGEDTDANSYIDDIIGWDFYNGDNNPRDDHGHGTHCAGIIGAVGNNSTGISGVCWNISIMPLKALSSYGSGNADDLSEAIYYATNNGANIISMSWGGYYESLTIKSAIEYAYSNNVVLVAAAGNDNINSNTYPAAYDQVISVAATDKSHAKAYFSNWGSWIDIAAPGVDIWSTLPYNEYENYSGTSMSCPFVAGIAGLILSKNSSLSNIQIKNILKTSANLINPMTSDHYIGMGCVNAYNALLNDTIPLAIINTSIKNSELCGNVYINGTANGSSFKNYSVYFGRGFYPNNWAQIISNNESKVNDGNLAIWNTSELSDDGCYTIRLVVNSTHNFPSIDSFPVKVNNIQDTLYVGGLDLDNNYTTIQSAVNDAGNGDKVFIYNGRYNESVIVNSDIEIIGESNKDSIIGNFSTDYAFWIDSNRCNISNLCIQDAEIGLVYTSNNNSLVQNNFFNNTFLSMLIIGSNTTISHNTYVNNAIGIFGEYLNYSDIDNNDFYNNDISIGIILSQSNQIRNNSIEAGSYVGVLFFQSCNNTIYNNSVTNIGENALYISYDSYDNIFYFNNLKNNAQNAFDDCNNKWYNQDFLIGNYWDDYLGLDSNSDGIGDTPYNIQGENNQDLYPLMFERKSPPLFSWIDDDFNPSNPGYNQDHFNTIQQGVDNIEEIGGIYVYNGMYNESVTLNKNLSIYADNSAMLDGCGDIGFNITCNNTIINGFTINNCTFGIGNLYNIFKTNNITISNNTIYDCGHGILFINSNNPYIFSNTIFNNSGNSIFIYSCNNSIISDNVFFNNSQNGITIQSSLNCYVYSNDIFNNSDMGISLIDSSNNNSIYKNNIYNIIAGHGIYTSLDCSDNLFFYNNFINNACNANDSGENFWYNLAIKQGNYWDNFDEPGEGAYDNNTDGIVDSPYNILGGNNQDLYPLTGPWGQRPYQATLISPSNGETGVSTSPTLKVKVTDPNNDFMNIKFFSSPSNILIGTISNVASGGIASFTWSGRSYSSSYSWYVIVNDGTYLTKSETWSFTTQASPPSGNGFSPPIISNYPPTADAGGPYTGYVNHTITFNASASTDDVEVTGYRWDWTNDGTYDTGWLAIPTATHTYTTEGVYTVKLEVKDLQGLTSTDTTTVTVTSP
jgi:parallel beta-helix repeat protein